MQACRAIAEPIRGRPLAEISIGRLLGQLFEVSETFAMETQPQLLLLQKTMVVAEGVGRALNPELNMWQLAQPLIEGWIADNLGPQAQLRSAVEDGLEAARRLPHLVERGERIARRVANGGIRLAPAVARRADRRPQAAPPAACCPGRSACSSAALVLGMLLH